MKAIVYSRYGPPEVLSIADIPRPVPKNNEVLIKVYASTVTAGDWRMRKADPFLVRIMNGIFKPSRVKVLGFEVAGVVEDTGQGVTKLKKGDEVFAFCGFTFGGYAEYRCLPENENIALKPANMTFEEAATVPLGAMTALQFLKQADIKKGQMVMIYGASGSVGTFAVQIARTMGAEVTGVCSTINVGLVKSLGADRVIDYKKENFLQTDDRFDVILDAVGKTSRSACRPLLKTDGKFVTVMSQPKRSSDDLLVVKQMIESGRLKTVIDKTYTMEQIQEAHRYVEAFHKKGNVVLKIA